MALLGFLLMILELLGYSSVWLGARPHPQQGRSYTRFGIGLFCGFTLDRRVGTKRGGSAFDGAVGRVQLVEIVPLEHSVVQGFGITKAGAYLAAASGVIPFSTPASSVFIRMPSPPLCITDSLAQSYRVFGGVPHGKSHVMTQEGFSSILTEMHSSDSPAQHLISEDGFPYPRGRILGGSSAIDAGFYSSADPSFHFDSDLSAGRSYSRFVVNSTELPSQDYDRSVFGPELSNWQPAASDTYCGLTLDRRVGTEMGGSAFDGAAERIQLVGIVPLEHSVVQVFGITKAGAYLAAASDVIPFPTPASSVFIKRTPSPPLCITDSLAQPYRVCGGVPYGKSNVMTQEGFSSILTEMHSSDSPAQHLISEDGFPYPRGRILGGSSAIDAGFYSSADPSFHFDSDLPAGRSYSRFVVNSTELPSQDYDRSVFRPELSNWQPAASDAYCGLTLDRRVGTEMGGSAFDGAAERIQLVGIVPLEHSVVQVFGITKAGAYLAAASDVIPFPTPASCVFIKRTPSPPLYITNSLPHSYRVSGGVPHGKSHVMTREGFLSTFTEVHTFGSPALHHISEDGLPNARGRILGGSSDPSFYLDAGSGSLAPMMRFNCFSNTVDVEKFLNGTGRIGEILRTRFCEISATENDPEKDEKQMMNPFLLDLREVPILNELPMICLVFHLFLFLFLSCFL
ncbi:hypothetical protein Tsubulata_033001 [Turnera subulata]|uniref:Peptidase A1 domain-containing protein n=1 Tax=Turnera subulata TaxID=218843 RepID=A0A9Q0FRB5_9ROSI|nr:hypothetical protein Tsubulata_033001 [Turnera subulata]